MARSLRPFLVGCAGALLATALVGCGLLRELGIGGDDPRWMERRYRGVSAATVVQLAQTAVQDRYPQREVDLYRGTLATHWSYGRYADTTHQALRERVLVETAAAGDALLVRLRVQQETSERAGRVPDANVDDWEPCDDDVQEARRMLMRLHVLLRDVAEPVVDPGEATEEGAAK